MTRFSNNILSEGGRWRNEESSVHAGHFNLVVVGATPGGIACAVRAAREGLSVLLVEMSNHVGGMWASGLQGFDTRYAGHRCPFLSEFLHRLQEHYRKAFGEGAPEMAMASYGNPERHGERPRFEPKVAERVFREMLRQEQRIRLVHEYRVSEATVEDRRIRRITLQSQKEGLPVIHATADIFADATYEADLAAAAGAPYRVGREARAEYDEPHAGRFLTTIEPIGDRGREIAQNLNLHFFNRTSRQIFPGSTGEGDAAVQAYTLRLTLTDVPENRRPITRPAGYDRRHFLGILDRSPDAHDKGYPLSSHYLHGEISHLRLRPTLPNRKTDWLGANFVGRNHAYPNADPATRGRIYEEHVAHALGTMYFLQHDPAVPEAVRIDYRNWGLARDEYVDTGNVPWMMYVREARRLRGMHVFTEHDASRHPDHDRTPVHLDSIAFAEWPMDSHDCNPVRARGSFNDGEMILADQTLPSQIPFRCLLTEAVENLLVPVCLSSTHIGWGTLRLEPVFVHTGEAAGVAAAVCIRDNLMPLQLDGTLLQRELLRRRIVVSYFSDLDLGSLCNDNRHIQWLGTRGFFGEYAARLDSQLEPALATAWWEILSRWRRETAVPDQCAALAWKARRSGVTSLATEPGDAAVRSALESIGWNFRKPGTIRDAALNIYAVMQSFAKAGLPV